MAATSRSPLARLRKTCLALPESHEVEAWGEPTFRVNNKLFAMYASDNNHHGAGRVGVWIKAAHVTQDMLVRAQPDRYFAPPYVGPKGWVGAYLDKKPDWQVIGDLLLDAYMLTVPKRLKAKLASGASTEKRR
ncbi:MAG: MmcQ/YjbR family DNA-binding protein [Gemmatimonadaceae bacterium]